MTRNVYRSAQGKEVDLGALILQNESVRAVGNMNVNARGDLLDSANNVIETSSRQAQRQYQKTVSNVMSDVPVHTSNLRARQAATEPEFIVDPLATLDNTNPVVTAPAPVAEDPATPAASTTGGLAAAIARSRAVVQKEKTPLQQAQSKPLRKI